MIMIELIILKSYCWGHFGARGTSFARGDVTGLKIGFEVEFVTGDLGVGNDVGVVFIGRCALAGRN